MKNKNYNHEYYLKHMKRLLKKSKLYGSTHKVEHREWHKAWAKAHPEQVLANKARFRVIHRKITKKSLRLAIELLEKLLLTM